MAKPVNKTVWCFLAVGFSLPCLLQTLFYLEIMPIERIPEGANIVMKSFKPRAFAGNSPRMASIGSYNRRVMP